jgi:hypothetical protein
VERCLREEWRRAGFDDAVRRGSRRAGREDGDEECVMVGLV